MGGMVEIRSAVRADLADVGRVHALSRGAAYAGLVPAEALARVTPEGQAKVWQERVATTPPPSALLVAVGDGQVVGFTFGSGSADGAELRAIHLLPERHGGGGGQALHDALLAEFTAWGCTHAGLWVVRGNERAQAFYRRNGWRHDGSTAEHEVGGAMVPILRYTRSLTA